MPHGARGETIGGRDNRRGWGVEKKLRIVAEAQEVGACVRGVARHDVYWRLLHSGWR